MSTSDGRALVAAYLKALRIARGFDQDALAGRLGVHPNTITRNEQTGAGKASDRLETAIAMARTLGGDVEHVVSLRAGRLPISYPEERAPGGVSLEVAADVAVWHVETQDNDLRARAKRHGLAIHGLRDLMDALRWEAIQHPERALKVYL